MDLRSQPDLRSAYDTARRAGAELVIADAAPDTQPGWKPDAQTPLLMLSAPPSVEQASESSRLWLSVNADEEIDDLAALAASRGARRALLLRPGTSLGDRLSDRLVAAWAAEGGSVSASAVYSGQQDYSTALKAALNIDASEQRYARLRQLLGEPAEFEPRRRQDLDSVFLLASNAQDARSLKPLLAFHFAGDLPVYMSNRVFDGRIDRQRDRDLNGASLVLSPWVLHEARLPQSALRARPGDAEPLTDLQALGADAFALGWRMAALENPAVTLRGFGGLTFVDSEGRLHRKRRPAIYRNGQPDPD